LVVRERYEQSHREHLAILTALDQRDPALAESAMRAHVASIKVDVLELL
jgi:DNA-binding GntR family transcriptional regulator